MIKKIKRLLSTILTCVMLVISTITPVYAKETYSPAVSTANTASALDLTVSYDENIKCGEPTTFTVNAINGSESCQYYLGGIFRLDEGSQQNVVDPSRLPGYQTSNTFSFTFYASGTYYLYFYVMDMSAIQAGYKRKIVTITIDDPNYPSIETIADNVVAECLAAGCSTDYEKALWLHDWLLDACTYDSSYFYCGPEGALVRGTGTCESYHRAYVMLLTHAGISTGRMEGNGHVWTAVSLDGKWYQVDTTWDDAGYIDKNVDVQHLYFCLTDDIMRLAHSDHTAHAGYESVSLDNNYFIRTGKITKWSDGFVTEAQQHIDQSETEFTMTVEDTMVTNYKQIIYNLVAYQLSQTAWKSGQQDVSLVVTYEDGVLYATASYNSDNPDNDNPDNDNPDNDNPDNDKPDNDKPDNDKPVSAVTILNGIDYSAVYDYNYYVNKYPDIKKAYGNDSAAALKHFVNYGMKEGRQAKATFNVTSYAYKYTDLRCAYKNDLKKYYLHYMNYGVKEGRAGTNTTRMQNPATIYNGVDYSAVYDYNYYVNKYPDIKKAYALDDNGALRHFVNYGMKEGRQAKAAFNVTSYAYKYADLRRAYKNDLKKYYLHYINYGKREGRVATGTTTMQNCAVIYNGVNYSAVYNGSYYISRYSDIKRTYGLDDTAMLKHFVECGMNEGRQGSANFNVQTYKERYADLKKAYGNNNKMYYIHYMGYGLQEKRSGKP